MHVISRSFHSRYRHFKGKSWKTENRSAGDAVVETGVVSPQYTCVLEMFKSRIIEDLDHMQHSINIYLNVNHDLVSFWKLEADV